MIDKIVFFIKLIIIFLPFVLFQLLNRRMNYKKEVRYKQYALPAVAFAYFILMFGLINKFYKLTASLGNVINEFIAKGSSWRFIDAILKLFSDMGVYVALVFISIVVLLMYISIKKTVLLFFKRNFDDNCLRGKVAGLLYEYDENDNRWYLKKSCAQIRTFIKAAYYTIFILSALTLFISYEFYCDGVLTEPFSPILSVIVTGEIAYFSDGLIKGEGKSKLVVNIDNSRRISMYALLRKPLGKLFGDKLSSEGTTINEISQSGGAIEDILASIEENGGHIGENYTAFIRKKIDSGIFINVDYLRSGYELACGKSLLFNTPFYDKLIPYAFYAINRNILVGKKVLVVLGRHGTEDDIVEWCRNGMSAITNVPALHSVSLLSLKTADEDDNIDIGIISRAGVHDLDIQKANINFLKKVGFVVIIEPSRLVNTAQIGLNLLIKCCGEDNKITFCSMDRNCDGLVDSLSHILMTNITEVLATEYPRGTSSFMCWKADDEHLQHRLIPGISRYLGLGTELSFVALRNQVKQTVWYGGDVYPVLDAHWISKQYYYDLLKYANLPANQESFDQYFKTSFNMCNEKVSENSYVTVEDDRNNLFESRRIFATIANSQSFVNVISSEYMLREYMADSTEIFTADAKAIPYITADYARTKRNSLLSLCLLLCVGKVAEKELKRKLMLIDIESDDFETALWNEMYTLFSGDEHSETDKNGNPVILIEVFETGKIFRFEKESTIISKREYSVESGKFETMFNIEDKDFAAIMLDDLQNAGYIAELESKDYYIGTELKGHVYQKYLPGQFFTLNGKYYEMIKTTVDNKILVRRASEHINGRVSYRQLRNYIFKKMRSSDDMGTIKTVNNIEIHHIYADFEVETSGYWQLKSYNDFENGTLVEINAVPVRRYFNKQILKLDFSAVGDLFSESVRKTLTVLLNEVFVTLFAENQPFISAISLGKCEIPCTYSLDINDLSVPSDNCIYIVEDSQLDIGLLVAVERNLGRIMQIISDYLMWNSEKLRSDFEDEQNPGCMDCNDENDVETSAENISSNDDVITENDKGNVCDISSEKDTTETSDSENISDEKIKKGNESESLSDDDNSVTDLQDNPEVSEDDTEPEDVSALGGKKENFISRFGRWLRTIFKRENKGLKMVDEDFSDNDDGALDSDDMDDDTTQHGDVDSAMKNNEEPCLDDSSKEPEVTYSE